MSEKLLLKILEGRSENKFKEETEETVNICLKKDITDEKKKDAMDPILDRVFMKIESASEVNTTDEDLKKALDGLINYIIKVLKKPIIQNLIDFGKYPETIFGVMMFLSPWLGFFDHSKVGDNFENKDE